VTSRPKFRRDLEVFDEGQGGYSQSVVLKDPVTEKYFRLSVYEYRFLKTLDGMLDVEEALERLKEKGHHYRAEDARQILGKAAQLGLVLGTKFGTAQLQSYLKTRSDQAKRTARFSQLYFLYIPLWNPDRFLERTLWIFRKIVTTWTLGLVALLAPGAIYLIFANATRFEQEYLFFFNWQNLLYLWITIALTKLIHEFAHAYVAKHFGLRVPRMGLAFLIFFPCLYCDTTDAWQLADRKQRMAISAAGIIAEGVVAILATYLWHFSRPGILNSLAYYLMAVSFLSTILFNGNPLIKFDGYFILADFLQMPKLFSKSLAYVKYLFMNRVLGISVVTNPATTPREVAILFIYGLASFAYRVFLYTAIVMGVYYRFDKLVGILLALLAAAIFLVRPVVRGTKSLYEKRMEIHPRPRGTLVFLIVLAVFFTPLIIPVSTRTVYPCYLASAKTQKLTVPLQTSVNKVLIRNGASVEEGALLFQLDPTALELAVMKKEIERNIARVQLQLLLLDDKEMGKAGEKQIELSQLEHEIKLRRKDLNLAQNGAVAPFPGLVAKLDYRLQEGFQPGEGAIVGELVSQKDCEVRVLIPEDEIRKIRKGDEMEIWFPPGTNGIIAKRVEEIKSYSENDIKDSPFSSRLGGEIATEAQDTERLDAPLKAHYVCSARLLNDSNITLGITGRCAVCSPPQSILSRLFLRAVQTLNRESIL